ncbi:scamp family-domain-containing protein [Cladochytrium replicatum]|nr:scamp family-domain-containing protein [Cladochytrium replicatum]
MIKDKELKMREADLAEREKRGGKYPSTTPTTPPDRRKNFPVCWPVMYHNIDDEIPEQHRLTMRWVYTLFIFNMATLWGNVLAAFIMVITHADGVTTAGKDLGMGVVYAVFAPVAAFFSWYRPVYNAFMKNSSMYYFLFFIFNGIHLVFNIYMCIGVPGSGSASTINMITMFSTPNTVMAGIVCAGAMGAWLLSAVGFSVAFRSYRYAGHSLESARNEAMGKVAGSGAAGWALRSAW